MPGSLMCPSWCTAGKSLLHQIFSCNFSTTHWCTAGYSISYHNYVPSTYQILLYTVALCHTSLSTFLCSAGVGRTGTYIALDITLDQMKAEKTVDIKGTMEKMRERRMNMIQTAVCVKPSTIISFGWVIQAVLCLHPVYI